MICQRCQERQATVHLTKVVNYEKTELHLCEVCAKTAGAELGLIFHPNFTIQNLIAGILEGELNLPQHDGVTEGPTCLNCGLTFSDFRSVGLLGCEKCYENFQGGLEPLLKRVQGDTRHVGKVPKRTGGKVRVRKEISELRSELQQVISREDYERAAQIRDEIRRRELEL